ncbi:MAG: hypothetical protein UY92_C0002G0049 [Candidatus Magasanikbacteria bacterium GW2011_GWA2_56_11]|uniref:Uncharacterized protein n=1 Tax=Candidatus Magasanikbacteria bacterium GW2011_GWA2_56_11 TaxID=1619044 RepID=A0A0G2ANK7_9BACT|nr:MAG: hypothetical protein UY92_C0002G0049 [Candidatus Magasanikbacteria bacterium GW2011_GWA2_56_11]
MFKPPKPEDKLSKYIDASGDFSNRDLKLGEWYVRHRIMLRELVVGVLVIFCVVVGGYGFYRWAEYLIVGYSRDERLRAELTKNAIPFARLRERLAPDTLQIGGVSVFQSASGKYDFFAEALNPNADWYADVEYRFVYPGGETEARTTRLLPGSRQPLTAIGIAAPSFPSALRLEFVSTAWQRIDRHQIAEPADYLRDRLQFSVENFSFQSAGGPSEAPAHTIAFTLSNRSTYSYWQAVFYVLYKDNGSLVGFKRLVVDNFRSQESRPIEIKSLADGLNVTDIDVLPAIDVFAQGVYIPLGR